MDQKAQISVEFILFAAIALLIVVVFAVPAVDQSQIDSVATAVRVGAENSTTDISLTNRSMQPIRVTSIDMNGTSNIAITVHFSKPVASMQSQILGSIYNSLAAQGYNPSMAGSQVTVTTTTHVYTVTVV